MQLMLLDLIMKLTEHLMGFAIPHLIEFKDPKDDLFYIEKHVEEIVVHSGSTEAVSA